MYWILGATVGLVTRVVSSETSSQETTATTVRVMATQHPAGGDQPTFVMGQAISVPVGGGGRGRPGPGGVPSRAPQGTERSATEEVERIIDESQAQHQGNHEGEGEGARDNKGEEDPTEEVKGEERKPNPKKRMWDEDKEAKKEERKRDEL
jgi:protein transport protein SEC20